MPDMMNPKMPGAAMPKPTSSPNILEWLLVVLMLVTMAGIGYLYFTLTQLNDSVMSAKADVMSVKTELMAQKQAMEEKEAMAMEEERVMMKGSQKNTIGPLAFGELAPGVTVETSFVSFPFTVEKLASRSQGCSAPRPASDFEPVLQSFVDEEVMKYEFLYPEPAQSNGYSVLVVRNVRGYQTMEDFDRDFEGCEPADGYYPASVTQNYLLFVPSCGTGYADDSGRPHGCSLLQDSLEDTFQLTQ